MSSLVNCLLHQDINSNLLCLFAKLLGFPHQPPFTMAPLHVNKRAGDEDNGDGLDNVDGLHAVPSCGK